MNKFLIIRFYYHQLRFIKTSALNDMYGNFKPGQYNNDLVRFPLAHKQFYYVLKK